jgi:hypothetical protein
VDLRIASRFFGCAATVKREYRRTRLELRPLGRSKLHRNAELVLIERDGSGHIGNRDHDVVDLIKRGWHRSSLLRGHSIR